MSEASNQPEKSKKEKKKGMMSIKVQPSPVENYINPTLDKIGTKIVADDAAFIPLYKTEGAACADLVANTGSDIEIPPGGVTIVDCGFSMQLPVGYKALVTSRSGLASQGLIVANGPGIIDSDYRGRIKVILSNVGTSTVTVKHADRVAQLSIEPVIRFDWQLTKTLEDSARGDGGLGSTGR
jgi:dUTP pyrophosphatase